MTAPGLWRPRRRKVEEVHTWRPRRSRFGELVQWDRSDHDWLEGRGERLYLIQMIDDAASRLRARFVRHHTTEENLRQLRGSIEAHGRIPTIPQPSQPSRLKRPFLFGREEDISIWR